MCVRCVFLPLASSTPRQRTLVAPLPPRDRFRPLSTARDRLPVLPPRPAAAHAPPMFQRRLAQMDAYRRKEVKPPHTPDVPTVDGSPAWDELFPEPEDGFPDSDASDWDEAAGDGLFDKFDE